MSLVNSYIPRSIHIIFSNGAVVLAVIVLVIAVVDVVGLIVVVIIVVVVEKSKNLAITVN